MSDNILTTATFDRKVKTYWLVSWLAVAAITVVGIPFIPFILIIGYLVGQRILDAMTAQLSERKLLVKRGIFFKVEKSIPLEKITDVGMTQGPIMRMFGLHGLTFETAGQSSSGPLVAMVGIEDASGFREAILAQKDVLAAPAESNKAERETTSPELAQLQALTASVQRIEKTLATLAAKQLKQSDD